LRVVFAGTPAFAATALEALLAAGHEVPLVLTQPDRPSGRGLRVTPSAVADTAQRHSIPVLKRDSLKGGDVLASLRAVDPDAMVVAAYGLILPPDVLAVARRGCLNIHASLLPRWRGAAPIQRALLAGDTETGICIMQMDAGLDTGPVLLEKRLPIGARDTSGTLTESLARLGAAAIAEALRSLDSLEPRPQADSGATYAAKIAKREARIDWRQSHRTVDRQVRAFNPAPGAETRFNGDMLKIWDAEPVAGRGNPGEVIEANAGRWVVACGDGALAIQRVQRPGGKPMSAAEFLRGARVERGSILESAPSTA
jgi:methionyl-tRNA formyltransferase